MHWFYDVLRGKCNRAGYVHHSENSAQLGNSPCIGSMMSSVVNATEQDMSITARIVLS